MLNSFQLNAAQLNASGDTGPTIVEVVASAEVGLSVTSNTAYALTLGARVEDVWRELYAQHLWLVATTYLSGAKTFYNPTSSPVLGCNVSDKGHLRVALSSSLAATASIELDITQAAQLWLVARGQHSVDAMVSLFSEVTLRALADLFAGGAVAQTVADAIEAGDSLALRAALLAVDEAAAELTLTNRLIISVKASSAAAAADTQKNTGHYLRDVRDMAGAWVTFKLSGEVVQGWVLNVEGDRPISEYQGFDFNSFACIGGHYFAANDAGLYTLGADTDDGKAIDAHVRSMMLDFGSARQKRVVAAYLGYTSEGTLVLKVRSVDDGRLTEHWYQAQEVTADAPREGYKPLGRGLKSRYWQFELANVDGADFELDKLELYPLQLSRRV